MSNQIQFIYDKLFARYGNLNWWPAKSPYEVIVGAVLTQNTKIYNNYHALIVINGKHHCRKKPVCNNCPLENNCTKSLIR